MDKLPKLLLKCVFLLRRKNNFSRYTAKVEDKSCDTSIKKYIAFFSYERLSQMIFYLAFWKRKCKLDFVFKVNSGTFTDRMLKHIL